MLEPKARAAPLYLAYISPISCLYLPYISHTSRLYLNLMLDPKARAALVFNDVLDNGQDDERTEHSGNAPAAGVKYAINCWIRAGPVSSLGLG